LRWWDGAGTIRLLAEDSAAWAMLLERCEPGTPLRVTDPGIVTLGIELLRMPPRSAPRPVVVHGDFNPGNLLAAEREPYLAIDPKPMIGDPAYDPWPLVAQLGSPLEAETWHRCWARPSRRGGAPVTRRSR
jgi:streptomycin 6-kinase